MFFKKRKKTWTPALTLNYASVFLLLAQWQTIHLIVYNFNFFLLGSPKLVNKINKRYHYPSNIENVVTINLSFVGSHIHKKYSQIVIFQYNSTKRF